MKYNPIELIGAAIYLKLNLAACHENKVPMLQNISELVAPFHKSPKHPQTHCLSNTFWSSKIKHKKTQTRS